MSTDFSSLVNTQHRFLLPDFLPEAARLTREWAHTLCAPSHDRHEGCKDYHAAWTTLRLIGAISGAKTDKDFFEQRFRRLAKDKPNAKVLIAGTADHAMLHMLLEAFEAANARPQVTVVDQCATAVKLNQWYADQVQADVTCVKADLRQIDLTDRFDLITTHSVFSFMTLADVTHALCRWKRLLVEGGALELVQAIRPHMLERQMIVFSSEEEADFVERAENCWTEHGPFSGLDLPTLRSLAQQFAYHKNSHVLTSTEQILGALTTAGLKVTEYVEVDRHRLGYHSSAPNADERAFSLRLVAERLS